MKNQQPNPPYCGIAAVVATSMMDHEPSKWPCGNCGKTVRNSGYSIFCTDCRTWFHRSCASMSVKEINTWAKWQWHCGCTERSHFITPTSPRPPEILVHNDANDHLSDDVLSETIEKSAHVLTGKEEETLKRAYFATNQCSSYGSIKSLMTATGYSRRKVQHFLATSKTYTKFRMAHRRKNFVRLKTKSLYINEIWSADLAFMEKLAASNNGFRYLLVVVDTLSRYLYVEPMKTKSAAEAKKAFSKIITTKKIKPKKLWVDKGTEFAGEFKSYCEKESIEIYSTNSETKSAFAERNIRSLKSLLYKFMHEKESERYIDELQNFVGVINARVNRMMGMAPNQVRKKHESFLISLTNTNEAKKAKFYIGDVVRLSKENITFMKGYRQQFTDELFTINDLFALNPPTYILKDQDGKIILGKFYESELIKYIPT